MSDRHLEFYRQTSHCGQCARPGVTCECLVSSKCGCWDAHSGSKRSRQVEVESLSMFDDAGPEIPTRVDPRSAEGLRRAHRRPR